MPTNIHRQSSCALGCTRGQQWRKAVMRRQSVWLCALAYGLCCLMLPARAFAGDWNFGCGGCGGGFGYGQVYYAPPTVSYAPPTVTIVPRYVVQPNYVIEKTYVVRPTEYVTESAPCFSPCGGGYVVNQGQYREASFPYVSPAPYGYRYRSHFHYSHFHYRDYGHRYYHSRW